MRRLLCLLLLAPAFGQNSRFDNIALSPKGPIANAQVAVCRQPANTATAPCSPLAPLCSSLTDIACAQPNPIVSDGLGNYHFYASSSGGPYTVQIFGPNVIAPFAMTDQLAAGSGSGTGTVLPNSGSAGAIAQYAAAGGSSTVGPDTLLNDSSNLLTYQGTSGVTISGGPLAVNAPSGKSGYFNLVGNTSNQNATANTVGFMGPNVASFTQYALQLPSTGPSGTNNFLSCPTPSASISLCSFVTVLGGTACTNGELALSAGWASTGSATVTAVQGTGQTCSWTITTGTTTAASPTVTDTLVNPLPNATTVCEMNIHGGTHTAVAGEYFNQTALSATAPVFTFSLTPTAGGTTYFVTRRCGP